MLSTDLHPHEIAHKEKVIEGECWVCGLCAEPEPIQGRAAYLAHVTEAHPEVLDERGKIPACRQDVVGHIDADTWFAWTYCWSLPDGQYLADCQIVQKRSAQDWGFWR